MKIVWLSLAQRDLASIFAYYQNAAGNDVAARLVQRIVHSASNLIDHPYLGPPSATTDGVHELQVARLPYVLPYRVVNERIEILRVFHESQDRPSAWQNK
ncbi:MAG: type II toxin-antitoxin system RelE/ParE family toxin [Hyphomicrobiales bacterium]|nr:type II toxin-antitoxin system RelE/ParE family toxin [Hyphomicrobiales bacterium]